MENGDGRAKIIQVIAGYLTLFPIFVVATQHSSYIMKEDQILIEQLNASSIEAFSELYNKYGLNGKSRLICNFLQVFEAQSKRSSPWAELRSLL